MANLTITVDEEDLKRARIKALEDGTSINAVLALRLHEYARGVDVATRQAGALSRLDEVAALIQARLADGSIVGAAASHSRTDLHGDRMDELERRRARSGQPLERAPRTARRSPGGRKP